ncbi:thioredoxin family protein [Roseofilum casamattae]|uniref:Thioredoxin family protein n=1 Tax=Roseofilum casamattae BLCC-M143 TaxID=3022442 RepID=A0ABT7C1C4_9CYAN|nr:thioredoxin family protein [Roseofilum casamattae]MDJ1184867.1 thioredoxin family protein [Roseofilum casamattae BLCC-M143]
MAQSSPETTPVSPLATRLRNLLVALAAIVLAVALFLGLQTKNPSASLSELAETSTPLDVALNNSKPTLMEFYANWCLSCQTMVPDMVSLRESYGDRLNFVMLNVDNSKWLPEMDTYRVDGIPHFVFLDSEGQPVAETIGELPKSILAGKLDALIAGAPLPGNHNTGRVSSIEATATLQGDRSAISDPRSHSSQSNSTN